ncbi:MULTISPECIES: type II CAAX endopeptidase family protein [unclassified Acinetobacter]|uniref:CPBP family intramembrane glutamic endopeptidase n=1 Tax=unclassified Acinetobacter TaxID=196816 RepID=UPI0018AA9160|nr:MULTISPECIES: type II CAAX endopeptidase family protein [unclassified Acinetobacter]MBJ9953848.1 CPBP family intramembrane metalloprotease [Acinetobacter baumannii]
MHFLQKVRAENFPEKIIWGWKDTFAVSILPLIVINGLILEKIFGISIAVSLGDAIFRGLLFISVCYLYKDMLLTHWQKYQQTFWRSSIWVVVGAILLQVVISLTRQFLPLGERQEERPYIEPEQIAFLSLLIISFGPLFTALLEDIVFRYTLLQKLFIQPWLWRMVLIMLNSILFGLIHYHNFDGNLVATISFMSAGLFLNLIYLWTRNIWHVLLIHFLNNAVLSLGGVLLLKFIQTFT